MRLSKIAVRKNSDGSLDDVVVESVTMFRAEEMSRNRWWMACYLPNGQEIVFSLHGKLEVTEMPGQYVDFDE